jgi:hypothetical protein
MRTSAGAAFNRSFAKWWIGGMLFGPNGPEHEAHSLFIRVPIRFSSPTATAPPAERLTLYVTRHHVPRSKVQRGQESFRHGDRLDVQLKTVQERVGTKISTKHFIVKVNGRA